MGLLPKVFMKTNKKGIPVHGVWISALLCCIPALLLDLASITLFISCSNLITYSYVTICGISLRYQQDQSAAVIVDE